MNRSRMLIAALTIAGAASGASAAMPTRITYGEAESDRSRMLGSRRALDLEFHGSQITGFYRFNPSRDVVAQVPLTGTILKGVCTVRAGESIYRGKCTESRFSGEELNGTTVIGPFSFPRASPGSAAAMPMVQQPMREPERRVAAATPPPRSSPPSYAGPRSSREDFRAGIPPSFRAPAVPTGFFDYVEGDDIAPQDGGASGDESGGSASAPAGLPAPAGTRWAYGRNRWVVTSGGGCSAQAQLLRGYCFGAVIGYLQSRPKQKDVTAIALARPAPIGTFISNDTPIRYQYVQVKRDGEWFKADRDLRGASKVPIPLGCHYAPVREGFIVTGPGPQGLQEAALFQCP